jgi:hypothetical protein
MAQIAASSGVGHESLYQTLKPGAQSKFETIGKVMHAIGFQVRAVPLTKTAVKRFAAKGTQTGSLPKSVAVSRVPAEGKRTLKTSAMTAKRTVRYRYSVSVLPQA